MAEIPRFHKNELIIPRSIRGYNTDEFIHFTFPPQYGTFSVFLEDLSGRGVSLGQLKNMIFIPNVYFPAHARLLIMGRLSDGQTVKFESELKRGQLYMLPQVNQGGVYSVSSYIHQK